MSAAILSNFPTFPYYDPIITHLPQIPLEVKSVKCSVVSDSLWPCGLLEVLVTYSCPTLCDRMGCSPSISFVHRILQTWILKWVAIPFSRGSSRLRNQTWVSHITVRIFTIWAPRKAPFLWLKWCTLWMKPGSGTGAFVNAFPGFQDSQLF